MTILTLVSLIALAFPPSSIQVQQPPKPVPSLEEVILRALQTHPEILVAEAKLAGAKADLELAKLALSQKIAKAKSRFDTAKQTEGHAARAFARILALYETKAVSTEQFELTREKAELAKTQLIEAEAEWKMYTPDLKGDSIIDLTWTYTPIQPTREVPVSPTDRERFEALGRTLKLKNADKLDLVEATKLLQFQPELKGLTLRVPGWMSKTKLKAPPVISWDEREMTVAGWLQFFTDEFNPQARAEGGNPTDFKPGQYEWYLREYGLVFVEDKPVGAPSLAEFLKAMRAAPTSKK